MTSRAKNAAVQIQGRKRVLKANRDLKMARSVHAYVRGNTLKFYEWLDQVDTGRIPEGPPVWICGDCHSGNLGPIANSEGDIKIQIRDLDQSVIGNPANDLIRLGLSLAMAVRGSDLPGITTAQMLERLIEGYTGALIRRPQEGDAQDRPAPVHVVMKDALKRRWKHLARERIDDATPRIPLGRRFWPISKKELHAIQELFATAAIRRLITSQYAREDDAAVEVMDSAYWMKGCSSLGTLRFAVVARVGKGKTDEGSLCIMDIKEAVRAIAPRYARTSMPKDNAERVVQGAMNLAPHLGERMRAAPFLDRAVVVRELFPQDLKLELDQLKRSEVGDVAGFLGSVVGRAHGRQMDSSTRIAWRKELKKSRTRSLDAPSWLWSSVVDLIATHEVGYLEHCRRVAARLQIT